MCSCVIGVSMVKVNSNSLETEGSFHRDCKGRSDEEFVSEITRGRLGFFELNSGISLHYADITEMVNDFHEYESNANLTITLLLEGQVEFYMDDQPFSLKSDEKKSNSLACGRIWSVAKPIKFGRAFKEGQRVKKIIITIDNNWLADMGLDVLSHNSPGSFEHRLVEFSKTHLKSIDWAPDQRAVYLAEQIINPTLDAVCMKKMVRESYAMELTTLALEAFLPTKQVIHTQQPASDKCRLIKVHNYIEENLLRDISLDEIAKNVGFSVSSLQRHFKASYGTTVVEYIRKRKLEMAKDAIQNKGMSISEACFLVGYSTQSSFATAFKRAFGVSPGTLI